MADMAGTEPVADRNEVAGWVGTLGVLATLLAALLLSAVLVGNVFVLVVKVPISPWLLALVEAGPVLGVFFSNIGTGINYYGTWRVLRGLDEYDLKADARNQAQGVPGMLQWVPQALLGCLPAVSAGLLAVSLLTSLLTLAPAPVHLLGYSAPSSGKQNDPPSSGSGGQVKPTPTPTPPPRVRFILRGATAQQRCDSPSTALSAVVLTLDNTASAAAVTWQLTQIDSLGGTGQPWAIAGAAQGTVGAGHFDTLALVPDRQVCSAVAAAGTTLHATLSVAGADTYTISDQVTAPPRLQVALGSASQTQTCPSFHAGLPAIAVTLDNSASNIDANWQVSDVQRIPGVPQPWATLRQGSGTVRAGQQATITLTPNPKLCYWNPLDGHTYRATVRVAGGPSFAIADTVVAPRLAALSLAQSGTPATCDAALHIGSYAVTLSNTGNVPAAWRFDAADAAPNAKPWAAANPSSGTVPVGGQQIVTLTPDASICAQPGGTTATYHAAITSNGGLAFTPIPLADTIAVPAVAVVHASTAAQNQTCDTTHWRVSPYTITLSNTGNVPAAWRFTAPEKAPLQSGTNDPWATASPSSGAIAAGGTATVTITPKVASDSNPNSADSVCSLVGTTTYHAAIGPNGGSAFPAIALSDTITVPAVTSIPSRDEKYGQMCDGGSIVGDPRHTVTLDNSKGNVPVKWRFTPDPTTPAPNGQPWATASQESGESSVIGAGKSKVITITPNPNVCPSPPGGTTYHATITVTSPDGARTYKTISVEDTITVPD